MPDAFHEVRFPTAISRRASGGPVRRTEIVTLGSGAESRNARWKHSRRRYNAGYGIRTLDELHDVLAFFEERRGELHGFRWKDHADFRSCPPLQQPAADDQAIGTGDGAATAFQLVKTYGSGATAYVRDIAKPVAGTVLCAVDGLTQTEGGDFAVDDTTGIVTFTVAPAASAAITAGYEFDVPVRFDQDRFEISLDAFDAGQVPDLALIEIRP